MTASGQATGGWSVRPNYGNTREGNAHRSANAALRSPTQLSRALQGRQSHEKSDEYIARLFLS
jgi:hypothetical protein